MELLIVLAVLFVLVAPVLAIISLVSLSGLKQSLAKQAKELRSLHAEVVQLDDELKALRYRVMNPLRQDGQSVASAAVAEAEKVQIENVLVSHNDLHTLDVQEQEKQEEQGTEPLLSSQSVQQASQVIFSAPQPEQQAYAVENDYAAPQEEYSSPAVEPVQWPEPENGENAGRAEMAQSPNKFMRWLTTGNVPVKIGVLVLFAGVAALLKYVTDRGWLNFPIEFRLMGGAALAFGALGFAWTKRDKQRVFSISLQGGSLGILMLTVFAAFKLYDLLPAWAAFALTTMLVAATGVLAVVQNARILAYLGGAHGVC